MQLVLCWTQQCFHVSEGRVVHYAPMHTIEAEGFRTRCGILQAYNMKFWKLHVRDRPSRREELAALGFVWGRCDKFLTLFNTTDSCVFSLVLGVAMLVVMSSSVGVVYLGVGFGVNVVAAPPPAGDDVIHTLSCPIYPTILTGVEGGSPSVGCTCVLSRPKPSRRRQTAGRVQFIRGGAAGLQGGRGKGLHSSHVQSLPALCRGVVVAFSSRNCSLRA